MKTIFTLVIGLFVSVATSQAAIVPFELDGLGGKGLLASNETGAVSGTPGSGGIGVGGISLNTDTNVISIDVRWGSSNGFDDLTGDATAMHIHLPTTNPAPDGFSENASPVVFLSSLTGYDPDAASGGFIGTATLSNAEETAILEERSYINVHTSLNAPGEIRGHLVIIPEPSSLALLATAVGVPLLYRRRRC